MGSDAKLRFEDFIVPGQDEPEKKPESPPKFHPLDDYHSTRVVVFCFKCRCAGILEFRGGFDVRKAERAFNGKPVRGVCEGTICKGKNTELVPYPNLKESDRKELGIEYDMVRSAIYMVRNNIPIEEMVYPEAIMRKRQEQRQKEGGEADSGRKPDGPIIIT